jgi:ribosomal protein L37E
LPFCPKCGKEVKEDDRNCASCGYDLKAKVVYRRHVEKDDDWETRMETWIDGIDTEEEAQAGKVLGGLIVLWLGLSFLFAEWNIFTWGGWWQWFLTGLGLILMGRGLYSYTRRGFKASAKGFLIGGAIVATIGVANLLNLRNWWAFLIIVVGLSVIASAFTKRF